MIYREGGYNKNNKRYLFLAWLNMEHSKLLF